MLKSNILSKNTSVFGLFGAGGFGRELMPIKPSFDLVGDDKEGIHTSREFFIDEKYDGDEINQILVTSESSYLAASFRHKYFNIAISDSKKRESIARRLSDSGLLPVSLISKQSYQHESSRLGIGAILCRSSIVTANSIIGLYFHANIFSYIAHDCVIGDYVTFAPRVSCNGNVIIGNHAYLGTNSSIKQGTRINPIYIGNHSIVGMGAVVTRDVPDYAVVVGNPARIIRYTNE